MPAAVVMASTRKPTPAWMKPPYRPTRKKPPTTRGWVGGLGAPVAAPGRGANIDQRVMSTIAIDRMRRKAKSGTSRAAQTPSAAPTMADPLATVAHRQSSTPW